MKLSMEMDISPPRLAQARLFDAVFDLVSAALVLLDGQGRILKANGVFAELFGYAPAQLPGLDIQTLLCDPDDRFARAVDGRIVPAHLAGGAVELHYRRQDGSVLLGRTKSTVVDDLLLCEVDPCAAAQRLGGCLEQDQWLQRIVETAPGIIGIFRLGVDGEVSMPWASPGYEEYYGVARDELERDANILFERIHTEDLDRVRASIAESGRTLSPWQCEYRVHHPLKGEIWLEGRSTPTLEADGSIIWFGFLHDISERKRIDRALMESEERFRLAFESLAIGMALLGLDGRWLRVNCYLCELLGREEDELLQTSSQALTHPDDFSEELDWGRLLAMEGVCYLRMDKRYRHRNGEYVRVQLTVSAIRSSDATPLYFVVQIEDLSRLLKAEEHLSLLDLALSHVHEAAYLIDRQARFRYVNDEACRSLGYSRAELLGMTVEEIDLDWTNEQVLEDWSYAAQGTPEIIESRHLASDGRIFPVELSITYLELDGQSYSLELARDITERRRLHAARQESEKRYREVFDNSSDCLYLLEITEDRQFRYMEVNAAFERVSGLDRRQLIGRCLGEVVPQAGRKVMEGLMSCLARGEAIEWSTEIDLPAGSVSSHSTFIPVRDEQGHIYRIVGISRDISERKRMETRLLTSEQQFRALAENSLNLIIRYDLDCRRTYVNPAFERYTGIPADRALKMPVEDGWTANMAVEGYLGLLRQVIRTGEPLETVLEWPDAASGERVVHAFQINAERGADGSVTSVLVKGYDITELKRHERLEEARLRIFERLAQGAPLVEVLSLVTAYVEQARPEFLISIRLVSDDGRHLNLITASSLPADYLHAVGDIYISEECNAAGWRSATIIVEDISVDPRCAAIKEAATKAGLRACWSVPIKDSSGNLLGLFSVFLRRPGHPTDNDLKLIYQASHLAAIAVERKYAEALLRESEKRYREIFDNTPDVIARFDSKGRFLYVNPAAEDMLDKSQGALLGRTFRQVSPRSGLARSFQGRVEQVLRSGQAGEAELTMDLPAGQDSAPVCYQVRLVPERDQSGALIGVLTVGRDVSAWRAAERRLKESHVQLRLLSSRRESTREEERKHIAREIHDELGQQLSALRMGISLLRLQFGNDQPLLVERVQALMLRVDEILQVVRNVATSLRPSALNMGLISALEWLGSEFTRNTGIECRLRASSTRLALDDERATAIFRVIQESLTNVGRHSRARRVNIHLDHDAEHLQIEVADDGRGFDPQQLPEGTLGLLGMRERGHMVGGTVTIDSAPGQGTRVRVYIPFQPGPELL
ncbi:PAS domain S-box protein [Pseudomonas rhizophila]|uniref:PAS domain S-box protein n=1 Tax=Pseudomonas rhizophila TaxID=2045200 RepID=UPI0030D7F478